MAFYAPAGHIGVLEGLAESGFPRPIAGTTSPTAASTGDSVIGYKPRPVTLVQFLDRAISRSCNFSIV